MKLKTLFVAILLLTCSMVTIKAQTGNFYYGPKLGLNVAWCTDSECDARVGINAGAFGQYFLTHAFAVQGELLFSMQGCKDGNSTMKLNYINIPILAKIYPIGNGLNIFVGPQFGFNVTSKTKYKEDGVSITADMDDVKTFDFALPFGVGYDFDCGVIMDFRWAPSLTKFYKDSDEDFKNSVISFNVGYKF